MSSRYMLPLLHRLAPHYRAYAVDLPGYGRSASPAERLPLPGLADALAGWMRVTGLKPAILIGNSMGCQVIAHLAVRHPELLTAAVLIGPTRDPSRGGRLHQLWGLLRDIPHEAASLPLLAVLEYLRAGPRRMWSLLREALHTDEEQRLGQLTVPTLVVRGAHDPICGPQWAEQVTRLLPKGQLVTIPGTGHAVNYSAPDALARHLRAFLPPAGGGRHNGQPARQ